MKIKNVDSEKELEFIINAQVLMAKETEDLVLDPGIVKKGVHGLYNNDQFGKYYLCYEDDRPIASLLTTYEWSDWRNGICLWIQSVYVLPAYRGKGVFSLMYQYLQDLVEKTPEYTGLRLYVDKRNTSAQKVYQKVGMTNEHYELYEWLK